MLQVSFFLNCFSRYALNEGATSIAVDVEDNADFGGKPAFKIEPHTVQRRGEVGGRNKDQMS